MARVTRIALDFALVSLQKINPAVSRIWGATKAAVVKTRAKPLVCNIVVNKLESVLERLAGLLESGVTALRNRQLPKEEKYLEKELDKVRQRMSGSDQGDHRRSSTSKAARQPLGTMWQYAKIELVPPMTLGFFHGPGGKKLENTVAATADGIISGLQKKIKDIEEEEIRAKKEKEAALKAAQEKAKAAAKAKEEQKRKVEEQKQKEVEKAAKAKADAKAQEDAKKAAEKPKEPPKAEKKKQPKKEPPKKKDSPKPAKK